MQLFVPNQSVVGPNGNGVVVYHDSLTRQVHIMYRTSPSTYTVEKVDETKVEPYTGFMWSLSHAFKAKQTVKLQSYF